MPVAVSMGTMHYALAEWNMYTYQHVLLEESPDTLSLSLFFPASLFTRIDRDQDSGMLSCATHSSGLTLLLMRLGFGHF